MSHAKFPMIDQASGKQKSSLNMSMKARTFGDRCLLDGQRTVRAVFAGAESAGLHTVVVF
jgi:hypothetical protein